jgi:hypothetical protein
MESALVGIQENQKKLTDLMSTVVRSQEHIAILREGHADQEQRLRKLEISHASGKWMERVVWLVATTGVAGLFKFYGGGDK